MKNGFLDMLNTYNRYKQAKCIYISEDNDYYTFVANYWYFKLYLRDIIREKNSDRVLVYINNVVINPVDYIMEEKSEGITINFKKSNFPYQLTSTDKIYVFADVEYRGNESI